MMKPNILQFTFLTKHLRRFKSALKPLSEMDQEDVTEEEDSQVRER